MLIYFIHEDQIKYEYLASLSISIKKMFLSQGPWIISIIISLSMIYYQQYSMGNKLCPAKQLIHEMGDFDKGEGKYDMFFKQCAQNQINKRHEILFNDHYANESLAKENHKQNLGVLIQGKKQHTDMEQVSLQRMDKEDENLERIVQQQIIFEDGGKYIGQTKNKMPHGKGEETNANGDYYRGNFQQGMKNGFGIYQFKDSSRYEGSFINNQMSGKGVYYFANGDKYEGQFLQNQRDGRGNYYIKQPNKEKLLMFQGSYKAGLKDGEGKLMCLGSTIEGIWSKGVYVFNYKLDQS